MSPSDGLGFRGVRHGQLAVIPNIGHVISSGKIEASQLPDPASRHRRVRQPSRKDAEEGGLLGAEAFLRERRKELGPPSCSTMRHAVPAAPR